jgi:tetratricopeptide (TPR) repeat protein
MKISPSVAFVINEFLEAEYQGLYQQSFEILLPFWDSNSNSPNTSGLTAEEQAEIFLRFGGVVGFLGNTNLIQNAQETSKNLLTQAHQQFANLSLNEKIAECENYLALAYTRTGEYNEAEDWLRVSFSRNLEKTNPIWLYSNVIESIINFHRGNFKEIIKSSVPLNNLFKENAPYFLNGCFHNHIGLAYKHLGNKKNALKHLKLASLYFQKADHKNYFGATQNNLAHFLLFCNEYNAAHACAQLAIKIFSEIGDKTRTAFAFDTQAQIYLAEGKLEMALNNANLAIEILQDGDSHRKLVECYRIKIKILIQLNQIPEALMVMTAAHNIANLYISQELGKKIIDEVSSMIKEVA